MKKQYLCSFTLSILVASAVHGATVRIKNETLTPVWARINEQTHAAYHEPSHPSYQHRIPAAATTLGASEIVFPLIDKYKGRVYPSFKKINPGTSRYFDSGLTPITKITFHRKIPIPLWFTIKTDIGRFTVEARVEYTGWEKAKRVK